jgi:cytochrome c-type biogenesis protein CcmE
MNEHRKRRLAALGSILVGLGVLGWVAMSGMAEDQVYYWSPTELIAKADSARDATVRLGGMVEPGSVEWNPDAQQLAFRITDGTETIAVQGKGAPPQMFREGIGVVVEGKLAGDKVFRTTTVMVKHSNEYQPPAEGERPEEVYRELQRTTVMEGS